MSSTKFQSTVEAIEAKAFEMSRQPDGLVPSGVFATNFAALVAEHVLELMEPTQHHKAFAQGYLGGVDGVEMLEGKIAQTREAIGLPKRSKEILR